MSARNSLPAKRIRRAIRTADKQRFAEWYGVMLFVLTCMAVFHGAVQRPNRRLRRGNPTAGPNEKRFA